jgi:UDP-glucose 4-epimerase
MRNILVLGGFGFLGSHLVEILLAEPDQRVHVVDNLSTSPLPLDALLAEIGPAPCLTWSIEDVETFYERQKASPEPWDEIYHLASLVGPAGILAHAGRIAAPMINELVGAADLAMRLGTRLLLVSTSEVYGGGASGLCSEDMPRIVPAEVSARLEYAVGKIAAETSLLNLCRAQGLDGLIVRPFNITGPRQSGVGGFVLPRFIGQALAGEDLTVFGDGRQIRAFTDVRDMAEGLIHAMRRGAAGSVYNLGNPENRCTILELAEHVREVTGSASGIRFVDPREIYGPLYAEADDKYPDATKARCEIDWQPGVGLRETIEGSWRYMRGLPEPLLRQLRGF